jgi:hemerythrin
MRPLRWKTKYLTGISEIDQRNRALTDILNELAKESGHLEHCQDMNELHSNLVEQVEARLSQKILPTDIPVAMTHHDAEIRQLLATSLPLPAKETSACRQCGLCERLEQQVGEWLDTEGKR